MAGPDDVETAVNAMSRAWNNFRRVWAEYRVDHRNREDPLPPRLEVEEARMVGEREPVATS